mmetsp:Transcript_60919/g.140798  ORF Transcript_60919/g.140798 Transcript_60919/m.140798 type:complete len:231 (-) Transcript_60919:29-721(-)
MRRPSADPSRASSWANSSNPRPHWSAARESALTPIRTLITGGLDRSTASITAVNPAGLRASTSAFASSRLSTIFTWQQSTAMCRGQSPPLLTFTLAEQWIKVSTIPRSLLATAIIKQVPPRSSGHSTSTPSPKCSSSTPRQSPSLTAWRMSASSCCSSGSGTSQGTPAATAATSDAGVFTNWAPRLRVRRPEAGTPGESGGDLGEAPAARGEAELPTRLRFSGMITRHGR